MAKRLGQLSAVQEMRVFTGEHDLATPLRGLVVPPIFGPIRVALEGIGRSTARVLFPLVNHDGNPIPRSAMPAGFAWIYEDLDRPYLSFTDATGWSRSTSVHTPALRIQGEFIITGDPGQLITSVTISTEVPVRLT